jgi:hypothetical protein
VLVREPMLGLVAASPLFLLWFASWRLRMTITEDGFGYRSWFTSHSVRWQEVRSVVNAQHLPYPRDRNYGPCAYQIRTNRTRFVVTLLYFAPAAWRAFHEATKTKARSQE